MCYTGKILSKCPQNLDYNAPFTKTDEFICIYLNTKFYLKATNFEIIW